MTLNTIAQSSQSFQLTSFVYEYSLVLINSEDKDTHNLTAAFTSLPTAQDWQQWLSGWSDTGYELLSPPQLLHVL